MFLLTKLFSGEIESHRALGGHVLSFESHCHFDNALMELLREGLDYLPRRGHGNPKISSLLPAILTAPQLDDMTHVDRAGIRP